MRRSQLATTAARGGDWGLVIPAPRPPRTGETAALWIEMDLPSTANLREHWRKRADRAQSQRFRVWSEWVRKGLPRTPDVGKPAYSATPWRVLLTRHGQRELDSDNLQGALKAIRDEVAQLCGFNDRLHVWEYAQNKRQGTTSVAVSIEVWWA